MKGAQLPLPLADPELSFNRLWYGKGRLRSVQGLHLQHYQALSVKNIVLERKYGLKNPSCLPPLHTQSTVV